MADSVTLTFREQDEHAGPSKIVMDLHVDNRTMEITLRSGQQTLVWADQAHFMAWLERLAKMGDVMFPEEEEIE